MRHNVNMIAFKRMSCVMLTCMILAFVAEIAATWDRRPSITMD